MAKYKVLRVDREGSKVNLTKEAAELTKVDAEIAGVETTYAPYPRAI